MSKPPPWIIPKDKPFTIIERLHAAWATVKVNAGVNDHIYLTREDRNALLARAGKHPDVCLSSEGSSFQILRYREVRVLLAISGESRIIAHKCEEWEEELPGP